MQRKRFSGRRGPFRVGAVEGGQPKVGTLQMHVRGCMPKCEPYLLILNPTDVSQSVVTQGNGELVKVKVKVKCGWRASPDLANGISRFMTAEVL